MAVWHIEEWIAAAAVFVGALVRYCHFIELPFKVVINRVLEIAWSAAEHRLLFGRSLIAPPRRRSGGCSSGPDGSERFGCDIFSGDG